MARPSAQGQATINTAIAAVNAVAASAPLPSDIPKVATAKAITTGTKNPEIRSASRCTRALPAWACSTSAAIWARCVAAPTRSARTTNRPVTLTQPPTTGSPSATSAGTLSPVTRLVSTADVPDATTPSAAIFSPGRTMIWSPTTSSAAGMRTSWPSRSTDASLAARASRASSAAPERRRARASAYRPASTNVVTPAATSR